VDVNLVNALTGYVGQVVPEAILGVAACVLFLGGTFKKNRHLWAGVAVAALTAAGVALYYLRTTQYLTPDAAQAALFAGPLVLDRFAFLIRVIAVCGGLVFVFFSWDEAGDEQAAEYHACVLLITAGVGLTGAANDLITLFLALELISIPTYVMLYLPRADTPAQEAAMKYFLLSVFSSALLLFGFSYLYGMTGTTNLPAMADAFTTNKQSLSGLALVALIMVVAGLGFRITAVPFHFYAPDVYQGTSTGMAALLSFVPKVAGFAALVRVLGFVKLSVEKLGGEDPVFVLKGDAGAGQLLGEQVPVLLWILAAVTMSLGNVLALLQDNVKRLLAYSSVAHAGYMLVGLAAAPWLLPEYGGGPFGGVEALLFYLVAYGAMTVGAFALLYYLSTRQRPVEMVDDLVGLSRSHPVPALVMVLFLMSLIGIPLTAGFAGKVFLFGGALEVSRQSERAVDSEMQADQKRNEADQKRNEADQKRNEADAATNEDDKEKLLREKEKLLREKEKLLREAETFQAQADGFRSRPRLYFILALIGMLNAAVGGWYYLRIAAVMFLRETAEPRPKARPGPVLAAVVLCAAVTLGFGVNPFPLLKVAQSAAPRDGAPANANQAGLSRVP
jgi:NADH-quinone oxidoreductase subunit N